MNAYIITPYVLLYAATAIISAVVTVFAWRQRDGRGGKELVLMLAVAAVWMSAAMFEAAATSDALKYLWAKVAYAGALMPVLLLLFAARYSAHEGWLRRGRVAALFAVPLVTFVLAWTNDVHHLIWTSIAPGAPGSNLAVYGHGPWFWFGTVAYSYTAMLIASILMVRASIVFPRAYRGQATALVGGVALTWIASFVYVSGLSPWPGLDLMGIALALDGVVIVFALLRWRSLELIPIARDTLVEMMPDALIALDARSLVVDMNPAAEVLTGVPLAEAHARPAASVLVDAPDVSAWLGTETLGRAVVPIGGRWFDITATPLRNERSTLTGRVVSLRDVTERKSAGDALASYGEHLEEIVAARTEELRGTNARLEEALAAKDEFLASMSHELRTPLNSIIGFSDLLMRGISGPLDDEQTRQLIMVNSSGKHLLSLVDEVLSLSKINANRVVAHPVDFDAVEETGSLVDSLRSAASERSITLDASLSDSLELHSDLRMFRQIVLNLLTNAIKFTSSGGVVVSIEQDDDRALLRVADTGLGIAESDVDRIFEPFTQVVVPLDVKPEGSGLGLAISARLAALLGGELSVESILGRGSAFTLSIPTRLDGPR